MSSRPSPGLPNAEAHKRKSSGYNTILGGQKRRSMKSNPTKPSSSIVRVSLTSSLKSLPPRAKKLLREAAVNERCKRDPLYWLQNWTETFDEKWREKGLLPPYRPFPRMPYFPFLFQLFQTERRLLVAKSRDMMISWAAVGFAAWKCQFFERQHVIVERSPIRVRRLVPADYGATRDVGTDGAKQTALLAFVVIVSIAPSERPVAVFAVRQAQRECTFFQSAPEW